MDNLILFEMELPDIQHSIQANEKIEIKVHRGQIFYELIEAFINIQNLKVEIEFKLVLPNGKSERDTWTKNTFLLSSHLPLWSTAFLEILSQILVTSF